MTADEARGRYRKLLLKFYAARGHWLVTNGPYVLEQWDGAKAVLRVFRGTRPTRRGSGASMPTPSR